MTPPEPIENHAFIGDLNTVALIALDGAIDFCCFPRFDSPTIFARLLDPEDGGFFRVAPELNHARRRQIYLPDSNIVLTRNLSEEGVSELSDFMPVDRAGGAHKIVRRVKSVRGEIAFRMECAPRFNYGRSGHKVEKDERGIVFTSEGPDRLALRLRSSVPVEIQDGKVVACFCLKSDESASFVLEDANDGLEADSEHFVSESFKQTINYWRNWISHCKYQGRWRETVHRSALALKLMVSQEFGSIVAAPTFGLPEVPGGTRNWDYRYTWIRDASFTIYALMRLGYTEEAEAFNRWTEARCHEVADGKSLQIMYGIDGRPDLREETLDHWSGYDDSRPVRIGNAAFDQLQLDIQGELLDSIYLYDKWGAPISHDLWESLLPMVNWVTKHWSEADSGIWETRGGKQKFLYSRLMCWVALDRAVRLARKRSFPAPLVEWIDVRDTIYKEIHSRFWNADRKTFVQRIGSDTVDAASLLMPLVRFIGPTDPRWLSTLKAIGEKLLDDSLVYRYCHGDGTFDEEAVKEGTFNMCTFWYAECLARGGDVQQGRYVFEKMLGYANHVGLYSEQTGPMGEHLGNFPQAFTHLGLISAAYSLDRELTAHARS